MYLSGKEDFSVLQILVGTPRLHVLSQTNEDLVSLARKLKLRRRRG